MYSNVDLIVLYFIVRNFFLKKRARICKKEAYCVAITRSGTKMSICYFWRKIKVLRKKLKINEESL